MNPEDTDKYKRFEDVMYRLADIPKKDGDEAEKPQSSTKDSSDRPVTEPPEESEEQS